MTNVELLKLIGSAQEDYVQEAQALRCGGGEKKAVHLGHRKLWLLAAAIITVLALSVTAYAVVTGKAWVQVEALPEVTEPSQEQVDMMLTYYPQTIPEGYWLSTGSIIEASTAGNQTVRNIAYENGELNQSLYFYLLMDKSMSEYLEEYREQLSSDPYTEEAVTVSGNSGTLFSGTDGWQRLLWENAELGYIAGLYTRNTAIDLLTIAGSVAAGEPLPESFQYTSTGEAWEPIYPQTLPEEYYCESIYSEQGNAEVYYSRPGQNDIIGGAYYIQYNVSNAIPFRENIDDIIDIMDTAVTVETVDIGGVSGTLVTIGEPAYQWELVWEDSAGKYNFFLLTDDSEADLAAIAESVAAGEAPEPVVQETQQEANYSMEIGRDQTTYTGFVVMYPHELPEGYSVSEIGEKSPYYGNWTVTYSNAAGDEMVYTMTYHLIYDETITFEEAPTEVDINGQIGYLYDSADGNSQNIIWTDAERGYIFTLKGSKDIDLAAVARSVAEGDELQPTVNEHTTQALEQLGDYQITELPEGMFEDSVAGWPLEDEDDWYSYVRRYYYDSENRAIFLEYYTYVTQDFATAQEVADSAAASYGGEPQSVSINGCPGAIGQSNSDAIAAWVMGDEKEGVVFTLYSDDFTAEELLEIAQSVEKLG